MKKLLMISGLMLVGLLMFIFGMPGADVAAGVTMAVAPLVMTGNKKIIKGLREDKDDKKQEMRALVELGEKESRDFTDTEQGEYDKLKQECENLEARAVRLEDLEKDNEERARLKGKKKEIEKRDGGEKDDEQRALAFSKFVCGSQLSKEERSLLTPEAGSTEARDLSKFSPGAGGVLVPTSFANQIVEAMLDMGGIRPIANVVMTASGEEISFPTMNDAGEKGALLGEAADRKADEDSKELFDSVKVSSFVYTSKVIKIDNELLGDEAYNLPAKLPKMLAARIANITNEHYTTGSGVKRPTGITIAAPVGVQAAAAAALAYSDLLKLEHKVPSVYRKNAQFMFNDNTLLILKSMVDADGRPLWVDNTRSGAPSTIAGYPYQINDEMPDIGANNKSITFGDHKAYMIRDVKGAVLVKMVEKYADEFRTGFVMFSRHDGQLLDGGTHPVKSLQHPAV